MDCLSKEVNMVNIIPKINGLYLVKNSLENLELVDIYYDKDGDISWACDYPCSKGSYHIDKPIFCYGPLKVSCPET